LRTKDQTRDAERRALWRAAATLGLKARRGKTGARLPTVFFVTDPDRTPDPLSIARGLPRGAGVIFRGFGRPDAERTASALAGVCRRRGLLLLIGADAALAHRVGAGGVHLPERDVQKAPSIRSRHPGWVVTGATHSPHALRAARTAGLDAALLSTAFASLSPTATRPLGPIRLAFLARGAGLPVIALGGVNGQTAGRLTGTGISGFAAVDGFSQL
jgi:thiamine-phosphate pyrophosphorylase